MTSAMANATRREFLAAAAAAPLAARSRLDRISLAAWSLNRSFRNGKWKNVDLPRICREELGVDGLEFVNTFFEVPTQRNLDELRRAGGDHDVQFVLIMIDQEGDMAAEDAAERRRAAVAHRKWVDIANFLGCHAVRCNLGGPRESWNGQERQIVDRAAESFQNLLDYSEESGLNILIENHGRASSDPEVLVALMKQVDHPRFGTLPDFGNVNTGDSHAEVLRRLMPFAKGVSVKSQWTLDGEHPRYDLAELLRIAKDSGYSGWWGIESGFRAPDGQDSREMDADAVWQAELRAAKLTKQAIEKTILS